MFEARIKFEEDEATDKPAARAREDLNDESTVESTSDVVEHRPRDK